MITQTQTIGDPDGTETELGPVPQLVLAWSPAGAAPARRPLMRAAVDIGRGGAPLGLGPLDDGRISRQHARLERRRDGWWLADRGSRNGTSVNGRTLTAPRVLADGDVFRTGDTLWTFRFAPVARRAEPTLDPDHPLVGISPEIDLLRADLEVVAPRDLAVLVTGETGTGKEVVARTLHAASGRRGRFVAQNCAALPPQLLEGTLFGHRKGAFTGADADRPGLLQAADGGTLFLDELGEMPPALQSKLLRLLETRTVRRLGSAVDEALDLRVVSATHRDLAEAVRGGDFRLDLYGRLAGWSLSLTPLRDRPEDVPILAARFTGRSLEANLVEALMLHPWPLNARGLRAVICRAEVRPSGPLKLDRRVRDALDQALALVSDAPSEGEVDPPADAPEPIREPPDADALTEALTVHRGRIAAVARALDASRQQVYRWLKRHGLSADDFR